eukprot:jgi/Mesvir1/11979/Mv00293-RA.1
MALAIENSVQSSRWGEGSMAPEIDALPYIDQQYGEPDLKAQVDALIEEEMKRSTKKPSDYLKDLPPAPAFLSGSISPALATEYERVATGQPMAPLDVSRYRLDPPPSHRRNDPVAWKAAVDNAKSQLEHQHVRLVNLELMLKFVPRVWNVHNHELEMVALRTSAAVQNHKKLIDEINRRRKADQVTAGATLHALEAEWLELIHKNMDIGTSCAQLEAEIATLKAQAAP